MRFLGRSSAGFGWGVEYSAHHVGMSHETPNLCKSGRYKSGLTVLRTRPNSQIASTPCTTTAPAAANSEKPTRLRSDCPDTVYFRPPHMSRAARTVSTLTATGMCRCSIPRLSLYDAKSLAQKATAHPREEVGWHPLQIGCKRGGVKSHYIGAPHS